MATKTRVINRSSISGRLVSAEYAKAHPKTTETERVRVPTTKSPSNKSK